MKGIELQAVKGTAAVGLDPTPKGPAEAEAGLDRHTKAAAAASWLRGGMKASVMTSGSI
jgi:hypothetical protein